MGAGRVLANDLDDFVAECDRLGGPESDGIKSLVSDFHLEISTPVDQSLDPFSPEYFVQQLAVYKEISGRQLDQHTGEQTTVDVETNLGSANPYGSSDIHFISKHSRAVLTTMLVSNLPPNAHVLDLGCGWGLSSEMIGFCGARVTAVDINPLFVDLIGRRAGPRSYDTKAILSEFDSFQTTDRFDLAFFYESLHHSVKPWETLASISELLKPNGKIAFAGEPINDEWKHWGLRLDHLSAYCIRKFGWFESGWTAEFLTKCFESIGFELSLFPHVGLNHGHVGVATRIGTDPEAAYSLPQLEFAVPAAGLAQLHDELGQRHHDLAVQHHELAERSHALTQQHAKLDQEHRQLLNSKWMRLRRAIKKTTGR